MLAKHALSQLSYGPVTGKSIGPKVRKAEWPSAPMRGRAKGTDVPAGA